MWLSATIAVLTGECENPHGEPVAVLLGPRLRAEPANFRAHCIACIDCSTRLTRAGCGPCRADLFVEEELAGVVPDPRRVDDLDRVAQLVTDRSHQVPIGLAGVDDDAPVAIGPRRGHAHEARAHAVPAGARFNEHEAVAGVDRVEESTECRRALASLLNQGNQLVIR